MRRRLFAVALTAILFLSAAPLICNASESDPVSVSLVELDMTLEISGSYTVLTSHTPPDDPAYEQLGLSAENFLWTEGDLYLLAFNLEQHLILEVTSQEDENASVSMDRVSAEEFQ